MTRFGDDGRSHVTITADLSTKTALVTGASGGLGLHFARSIAAAGARTVLAARRLDRVENEAAALTKAGYRAIGLELDVTSDNSVKDTLAAARDWAGPVDVLVNNAGIADGRPLLKSDENEFRHVLEVNLVAARRVAVEVARDLIDADKGGSIINIASILSTRVANGVSAYAASKAALLQLTRSMAIEWARHKIRVNAMAPGYILTDINRAFFESDAGKAMIKRIPQRRLGRPEDLDGALLLLASDESCHMTGTTITVDGGHSQNTL